MCCTRGSFPCAIVICISVLLAAPVQVVAADALPTNVRAKVAEWWSGLSESDFKRFSAENYRCDPHAGDSGTDGVLIRRHEKSIMQLAAAVVEKHNSSRIMSVSRLPIMPTWLGPPKPGDLDVRIEVDGVFREGRANPFIVILNVMNDTVEVRCIEPLGQT